MVKWILFLSAATLVTASIVSADNITIYDGIGYTMNGTGGEDNETEPGMINNQSWDLESFQLTGNDLGITAGFDLKDGHPDGYNPNIVLGDIFIDVDGNAEYGETTNPNVLNFGYEYAVKLNFDDLTYNIYELNANSILTSAFEYNSPHSDPFTLLYNVNNPNESVIQGGSGTFSYTDFSGTSHNSIDGIDLSCLDPNGTDFIAHVTMSCGNDNMMGQGSTTSVPEPSIIGCLILGLSMLGITRKRNHR